MKIQAAVVREPYGKFSVEDVNLAAPNADEVLVRMVATGICHTDTAVVEGIMPLPMPMVLGHEGAGIIEQVGADVQGLAVGDHVVLTFNTCGHCHPCDEHHPAYCDNYVPLNFFTRRPDGTATITTPAGEPLGGAFFGQSSFATYALASQRNTIKVRKDAPLELLGPLGCGLSTGAGAVINVLKPRPDSTFVVFGTGALGSAAIMAAKTLGVQRIVAVDRVASRLELAREIGATDTINTAEVDLPKALEALGGINNALDTTGVPKLIEAAITALANCGTLGIVGASHESDITISVLPMISGKVLRGIVNGDCVPENFIPELVDLYMQGKFPIDKLSAYYSLADINQAVADSASGKTIKPILKF